MRTKPIRLFNTPMEIGLRSLIIISVCKELLDAERLMYLDYLCLNTSDIGGPESLHPPIPNRGVQVYSKKQLINRGLNFLLSKELVELVPNKDGFMYKISDAGTAFLGLFHTKYFSELGNRASWVVSNFGYKSNMEIREFIDANIQKWGSEFALSENID